MKKKSEMWARIRYKKEDTQTSSTQFYLCAKRKSGAGFKQNDLQRKKRKTKPSSKAAEEHFQSHTMTPWSAPCLRSICGTTRNDQHRGLLF